MKTQYLSPLDVAIPPSVIFSSTKLCYDHARQQTYFSEIKDGLICSELMAQSTQTYRNDGTPYDADQD
jgi:hypothetical protein